MNQGELYHYGTPRHSGRYPWGSGENPYQHTSSFLSSVNDMKRQGMSEVDIAKGMNISTTELRKQISLASEQKKQAELAEAMRLKGEGMSVSAIGRQMGVNESTVRGWLSQGFAERRNQASTTAEMLKEELKNKKAIDIGPGAEIELGIKKDKLKTVVSMLEEEGYNKYTILVEQAGNPGKYTKVTALAAPGVDFNELAKDKSKIHMINERIIDVDGSTKLGVMNTQGISSKRVAVRYKEDGGADKDGVIELRRGVDDISLNKAQYAQVRIAVDGTHYLKGMAMYSDDLPDGVDVLFNTNKSKGTPMMSDDPNNTVLKILKRDKKTGELKDNPFGASIQQEDDLQVTQRYYIDKDGNKKLSAINVVNEPGDWNDWSRTLASQFLSKQSPNLAKKQLNLAYAEKKDEFDEICALTNPTIKKKLLDEFAEGCDSAAVHLKAAALPRQHTKVILPISDVKGDQIYAPDYKDGTKVVLIRYPHAGTFEIPELTVNNKSKIARSVINNAKDAVGINAKVAQRLSGADFDGDTVVVIPVTNSRGERTVQIRTTPPLQGLKDFDPQEQYKAYPGMKTIKPQTKQTEMGKVSNLITDMTLLGASSDEIARAVRHSMVVIDAEKHNLDYKRSEEENGIRELKKKYQGKETGGAATLISRAKSETHPYVTKEAYKPDPVTGKKIKTETGEMVRKKKVDKKTGEVTYVMERRREKSTRMADTDDAYTLISDRQTTMERVYADYANSMKALANEARKEMMATGSIKVNASAKKTYAPEVKQLTNDLQVALKNAPRERQAQIYAAEYFRAASRDNPDMTAEEKKKIKTQALATGRTRYGAKKQLITITDREWDAIQAGAVSETTLSKILDNTDVDLLKQRATPRTEGRPLTDSKKARIKAMSNSGHTLAEIAETLGISTSTVSDVLG